MSKKRIVGIIVTLFILVAALTIVSKRHHNAGETTIGVILPLTGNAASYGKSLQTGIDLAQSELKKSSGLNLTLSYEDSKGEPAAAVSAINKLITVDGAKIIIGDMFSNTTLAIAPIAQRNRVILISPTSSAAAVPRVGDCIFSIYPADAFEGRILAQQLPHLFPKATRVAIVYSQAEAMIAAKDAFKASLSHNLQIVDEEGVAPGTSNLSSVVDKIQQSRPQLVCIVALLPETAVFLKQATQRGMQSNYMGVSTCYDPKLFELAGNAADGLVFSAPAFDVQSRQSAISPFVAAYQKRYGKIPDVWAAYGYDVLHIAVQGVQGANDDSTKMLSNIASIKNFDGVTGRTSFNKDRSVTKQLRLLRADGIHHAFLPLDLK